MGIFGPHHEYPPELQRAMNHVERFAAMLAKQEVRRPPSEELGRAWLAGRIEEVETLVASILEDWRSRRLSDAEVGGRVVAYLRALHEGAERHLSLGGMPECCIGDIALTVSMTPYDQGRSTVLVQRGDAKAGDNDTLVDPVALVREPDDDIDGQ